MPSLVQQAHASEDGSGSVVCTLPVNFTNGNSLIVVVACSAASTISSVITAAGGVPFTQAVTEPGTGIGAVDIWYLHNYSGFPDNQVLVSTSSPTASIVMSLAEWSGLLNAVPESTDRNAAIANSSPVVGPVTPVSASNLLIAGGGWAIDDYLSGPTNSFVRLARPAPSPLVSMEAAYLIQTSATPQTTGWFLSAAIDWSTVMAAFGAAAPPVISSGAAGGGFAWWSQPIPLAGFELLLGEDEEELLTPR